MTLSDITLLAKKILIGILVALIPALIILWGLRLTQKLLSKAPDSNASIHAVN